MKLHVLPALVATVALATPAHANGRFPRAQRVIEDPADGAHLIVGATYGMLETTDGGQNWYLLCESSFAGEMLGTVDCTFDVASGGALLAAYGDAMTRSEAPGCDFAPVLGGDMRNRVVDFSVSASSPADVIALVSRRPAGGTGVSALTLSSDGGAHFAELGELPTVGNFATTVDRAPSEPDRVYVSGLDDAGQAVLLVSNDGGASFETRVIAGLGAAGFLEFPYIAAVHPARADVVFVRTVGRPQVDVPMPEDALLVTFDAGATWQELLRAGAEIYGFALTPDGERVFAGFGNPRDLPIDSDALGIYHASIGTDAVGAFTHATHDAVSCLKFTARGLYACATDFEAGFQLGLRADGDLSGGLGSFTPLLRLADVKGPLACPAGSSGERCALDWPTTCAAFGASCAAGGAPASGGAAGTAGSGAAGAATTGGAPNAGNSAGGAANASGRAPSPAREPSSASSSSCACRLPRRSADGYLAVSALFVACVRRRRRALAANASTEKTLAQREP